MNEQTMDKLVILRATVQGHVHFAKSDIKYWHDALTVAETPHLRHCASIRMWEGRKRLWDHFHNLQDLDEIIKEAQDAEE